MCGRDTAKMGIGCSLGVCIETDGVCLFAAHGLPTVRGRGVLSSIQVI